MAVWTRGEGGGSTGGGGGERRGARGGGGVRGEHGMRLPEC